MVTKETIEQMIHLIGGHYGYLFKLQICVFLRVNNV